MREPAWPCRVRRDTHVRAGAEQRDHLGFVETLLVLYSRNDGHRTSLSPVKLHPEEG